MRKIYDATVTQEMLSSVLPSHFKMVSDKTSNGYKFMNALYGIELTSILDYLDQARHYSSFENFDYGLDYDFSTVKFPKVINSGFVYGLVDSNIYPIKITTNEEFMDGVPTRFTYNDANSIELSGYIQASGNYGLEYMRVTNKGSGVLYINTNTNSEYAVINSGYQTYKLPIDDLLNPQYTQLSGVNFGIDYQNYTSQQKYELLNPTLENENRLKYAFTKKVSLPGKGDSSNPKQIYTVDYYQPEVYYWDEQLDTYKPVIPMQDKYLVGEIEEYHRQALNNPAGTGVYNISYLELEHVPISGTLRLFDIDTLTSGNSTEILKTGTNVYKYDAYMSGEVSPYYTYIGYDQEVPLQEGLDYVASGVLYTVTSWDYVYEDDGLVNFNWVTDPSKPITNKIKITNPIGRYYVEYTYVVDKYHNAITTATANRYVKYNENNHIFSTIDVTDNAVIVPSKLSVEKDTRRAVTFDGETVRPGTNINELILRGVLTREKEIRSSSSINVTDTVIPGYIKNILPNISDYNVYDLNHHYNSQVLTPVSGLLTTSYISNLSTKISNTNHGISENVYYDFYNENLNAGKVLRVRFRPLVDNSNYVIIESTDTDGTGWKVSYTNNIITITDNVSTVSTLDPVLLKDQVVDMILIAQGSYNYSVTNLRYSLYISFNGEFFGYVDLFESSLDYYIGNNISKTTAFVDTTVDLDFIKIYNEGTINGDDLL